MNAQTQRHWDTRTHEVIATHAQVARAGEALAATGIGSCVVIILYDPGHQIAAMAHPMLPQRATQAAGRTTQDCMYVDEAIDWMVAQLEAAGAACTDLEAHLVGGADMFTQGSAAGAECGAIGLANVREAHACLARQAIPVLEQFTGGTNGRSVHFYIGTRVLVVHAYMMHNG